MSENVQKRETIKITILGNQSVGKTTIRSVFLNNDFSEETLSTVGYNKLETMFKLEDGKDIKLLIWDTAGQERFHSIALSSVKNSQGIILVYDVSNRTSFNDLNTWINGIKEATDKVSIILFGNKCDIQKREVTKEEAEKYAKDNKIPYIETSAKLNINIEKGFNLVVNDAYKKYGITTALALQRRRRKKNKKC